MLAAKPPEFRRRAVDLAQRGQQPVGKVAADLWISESCLRRWMAHHDAGRREAPTRGAIPATPRGPGPTRDTGSIAEMQEECANVVVIEVLAGVAGDAGTES